MNVGYFKNQTFKAQDWQRSKIYRGMMNIPFYALLSVELIPTPDEELAKIKTPQYIKLCSLSLKITREQGRL